MPRNRRHGKRRESNKSYRSTSSPSLSRRASSQLAQSSTDVASSSSARSEVLCSICLNQVNDLAKADGCLHGFCKECIVQWSRRSTKCPMCRSEFHNILFSIRSDTEYEVLPVERPVFALVPMLEFLREFVVTVEAPVTTHFIIEDDITEVTNTQEEGESGNTRRTTNQENQTEADHLFENFVIRVLRNNPSTEGRLLRANVRRSNSAPAILAPDGESSESVNNQGIPDNDEDQVEEDPRG